MQNKTNAKQRNEHDARWQCMHGYSACDTKTNLIAAPKKQLKLPNCEKKKVMDHRDQVQIRLPKRSPCKSGRAKAPKKRSQWFQK
jgi:hypothetical protein